MACNSDEPVVFDEIFFFLDALHWTTDEPGMIDFKEILCVVIISNEVFIAALSKCNLDYWIVKAAIRIMQILIQMFAQALVCVAVTFEECLNGQQ